MATLPTVRSGAVALYPIQHSVEYQTGSVTFQNGKQQRYRMRAPINSFNLLYRRITLADRDSLETFFIARKGDYDPTWDFTLGTLYGNLRFMDRVFTSRQTPGWGLYYDVDLKIRQTINPQALPVSGGAYPTFANGLRAQLPFVRSRRFYTAKNEMEAGPLLSFAFYANGLTGFPTRGLMSWELAYPVLSDADTATLQAFYVSQSGRFGKFSFTDPDDLVSTYPNVHFADDVFQREYVDVNQNSVTVRLEETN